MSPSHRAPRVKSEAPASTPWRARLHEVIFEADTPAGKAFDLLLILAIALSVLAIMLESVKDIDAAWGPELRAVEWVFTGLFTVEYVIRLMCVRRPGRYARSFFAVIDLLAILPSYGGLFFGGAARSLLVVRAFRLLRVFRVLKLVRFLTEGSDLLSALRASRPKITVFIGTVITLDLIVGALMYLIESDASGFTSIPRCMYWAIVTMTTVGYGDIAPQTLGGQVLASAVMILGYGIIAVPTGIVTVELGRVRPAPQITTRACRSCGGEGHDADAVHCKHCGAVL